MKLPRDLSGTALATLLHVYGYDVTRQTGSHLRLTSRARGKEHHISIPRHSIPKVGTLSSIVTHVASYLGIDRSTLLEQLFGH